MTTVCERQNSHLVVSHRGIVDHHAPCSLPAHFTVLDQSLAAQGGTGITRTDMQSHQQGLPLFLPNPQCRTVVRRRVEHDPFSLLQIHCCTKDATNNQRHPSLSRRYWTATACHFSPFKHILRTRGTNRSAFATVCWDWHLGLEMNNWMGTHITRYNLTLCS
jgi:hypothetical protein